MQQFESVFHLWGKCNIMEAVNVLCLHVLSVFIVLPGALVSSFTQKHVKKKVCSVCSLWAHVETGCNKSNLSQFELNAMRHDSCHQNPSLYKPLYCVCLKHLALLLRCWTMYLVKQPQTDLQLVTAANDCAKTQFDKAALLVRHALLPHLMSNCS